MLPKYRSATESVHQRQVLGFTDKTTVLLIGDSIFQHFESLNHRFASNILILAKGGDTAEHLLWRLGKTPDSNTVKQVILEIGTNNLGRKKNPEYLDYVCRGINYIISIIARKYPSATIHWLPLYGRADRPMSEVEHVNDSVEQFIETSDNKLIVNSKDFWYDLLPNNNYDRNKFFDHVHLNEHSYTWFYQSINRLIE
jgi:hypothetical protein